MILLVLCNCVIVVVVVVSGELNWGSIGSSTAVVVAAAVGNSDLDGDDRIG